MKKLLSITLLCASLLSMSSYGAMVASASTAEAQNSVAKIQADADIPYKSVGDAFDKKVVLIESNYAYQYTLTWHTDDNTFDQYATTPGGVGSANQRWALFYEPSYDAYTIMCGPLEFDGYTEAAFLTGNDDGTLSYNNKNDIEYNYWQVLDVVKGDFPYGQSEVVILRNVATGQVLQYGSETAAFNEENSPYQRFNLHVVGTAT